MPRYIVSRDVHSIIKATDKRRRERKQWRRDRHRHRNGHCLETLAHDWMRPWRDTEYCAQFFGP